MSRRGVDFVRVVGFFAGVAGDTVTGGRPEPCTGGVPAGTATVNAPSISGGRPATGG